MKVLLLLSILLATTACNSQKIRPTDTPVEPAPATAIERKISYRLNPTEQTGETRGGYWQVIGVLNTNPQGKISDPITQSAWNAFAKKVLAWFYSNEHELLITAQAKGKALPSVPAIQVFHADSTGTSKIPKEPLVLLTPPLTDVAQVDISLAVVRAKKTDSNVVTAVVDTLAVVLPALGAAGSLTKDRQTHLSNSASKVDDELNKLLLITKTDPITLGLSPFQIGSEKPKRSLELFAGNGFAQEDLLFTVEHRYIQSILAGSGLSAHVPSSSSDIKAVKMSTADGRLQSVDGLFREADQSLVDLVKEGSRDSLQRFCSGAHDSLREKLGMAEHDRTAVIWAYLSSSKWWREGEVRPSDRNQDSCFRALAVLSSSPSPLAQLPAPADLSANYVNAKAKDDVWKVGSDLREKLIPIAIQTADNDERKKAWRAMLSEKVVLASDVSSIALANDFALEAESTRSVSADRAAELLAGAPLTWNKKTGSCFARVSEKTSRLAMRARSACVTVDVKGAAVPMEMMFVLQDENTPKLSQIHFWPDSDVD